MSEKIRPELPGKASCHVCGKDIVSSEAKSVETQDYMLYFCGLDCYEQWRGADDDKGSSS